ncbi:MAG: MoaD/ThiS family protein [Thermodesulfatator sp.]|nr:MAG: MoaD/ThiS family protein [Thermodesulfatator sp.]
MTVIIRLFGRFRLGRFKEKQMNVRPGTSVSQVIELLEIPLDEVGVSMVNSRHCRLDHVLSDNDVLALFPMVGGG